METREDMPRVSVDSVQDWNDIRTRYREAALESIEAQIAANQSLARERDAMITNMDDFIDKTFSFAQNNLRVNGEKFESLDASGRETEPFDEALDRRIWSLASTRLQWHKRISEVRRTIPNEIKTSVSKFHEQHNTVDEARLPPHTGDLSDPPEEDANQRERIQESIQTGSALVNELGQTTLQQRARGERVKIVSKDMEALKP